MNWNDFDAALFDLDGVLTPTATVHMAAWSEMFSAFLAAHDAAPYTEQDYFDHVDGKPRYDGVRDLLASRGITLPEGNPDDPSDAETVCGLGNRKNETFNAVLSRDGVEAYPGSVRLVEALAERGTKMAVVSSSKNAPAVLATAGIDHYFPVVITAADGLPGKPAPDTFLAGAAKLGVEASRAVVLEDATSGVAAGRAGDFGLVVGVDRGAGVEALTQAGADRVVTDLQDLLP